MKSSRKLQEENTVPTISRVCGDTLVELVYDPETKTTALAVSRFGGLWNIEQQVQIETSEVLVPYSGQNNLITSGCVLFPSRPMDYGTKEELISDIRDFLHRYVALSSEFEVIASYYVLLSWVHERFNDLCYLRLRGDYGSGKTRGLITIGSLCYKPIFASAASTVSPLFHIMNEFGGTLIFDEADLPFSDARADIVKLLNNGTTKGMPVLRTITNRNREFSPYAFKVFGPKVVAMRDAFEDRALESRFLTEETGRIPLRNDIPIQLPETLQAEALKLRNRLLHYRLCHYYEIKPDPTVLIDGIEPRLNQMAMALLSLIDDKTLRAQIARALIEQSEDLLADRREQPEISVLEALYIAFTKSMSNNIPIRQVAECYKELHRETDGETTSNKWIGSVIRRRLHLKTRKTNGVYVVPISEGPKIIALATKHGFESAA